MSKSSDSIESIFPKLVVCGQKALSDGGLTKREFYAAVALHGLLAAGRGNFSPTKTYGMQAVELADELCGELEGM